MYRGFYQDETSDVKTVTLHGLFFTPRLRVGPEEVRISRTTQRVLDTKEERREEKTKEGRCFREKK